MQAWEDFLKLQEKELGTDTVAKWLRTLKVLRFDACNLYLQAKDSFQALWFEEHIRHQLQSKFFNNNNKRIRIHLSTTNDRPEEKPQAKKSKAPETSTSNHLTPFSISFEELDPYCSFDNFVTTDGNLLGFKLLHELCTHPTNSDTGQLPAPTFNPIFLHGHRGVGKTHLLMACAHELKKRQLKVIYSRAETFTEHVIKAIRAGEMQTFRKAYRNIDVLLIDDVHVLSRKSATQEEFFHTFNTLHLEGKQLVLTSNCAPQELKFIEPRLVSRFEWGIVLPLTPLPKEKLRIFLQNKSRSLHFELQKDVTEYLIETFPSSAQALSRAIEALSLRSHLDEHAPPTSKLTIDRVQAYLSDLIVEEQHAAITPQKILQTVAEFYGIRTDDILSKSHAREYTLPRQVSMYLCRSQLNMPYMKIGDFFSRDHSTVMTSVKQIRKQLDTTNKELSGSIGSILNKFQMAATK